jgi:hypothetical protein
LTKPNDITCVSELLHRDDDPFDQQGLDWVAYLSDHTTKSCFLYLNEEKNEGSTDLDVGSTKPGSFDLGVPPAMISSPPCVRESATTLPLVNSQCDGTNIA